MLHLLGSGTATIEAADMLGNSALTLTFRDHRDAANTATAHLSHQTVYLARR
jgi:hypothetical protein